MIFYKLLSYNLTVCFAFKKITLISMMDILYIKDIKKNLLENYKNFDIKIFDSITSTNDFAKELIDTNNFCHGTTIIANSQTKGRGRFSKTFYSPKNTGIYFSTILNIPIKIQEISLITIISAISVCNTISKLYKLNPKIKWINDIYLNDKKVCGILVENIIGNYKNLVSKAIIVGIGINISTNIFPEEIKNKATSIMSSAISRNIVISELINNIFNLLKNIYDKKIIEEYKKLSFVLNKKISYIKNGEKFFAKAIDINQYGNLIIEDNNNNILTLDCNEISIEL